MPVVIGAFVLAGAAALAVASGAGTSVRLAVALTGVEAAGLLFVIAIGLPAWPRGDFMQMPTGLAGVGSAAALIFFAYLGFDEVGNFAEEMRAPARDLIRELIEWFIGDVVDELGSRHEVEYAYRILQEGSSADRQLATYQRTGDYKAVVDQLIQETSEGVVE